jgi:cleavage and polyadenylation specificity factor subunit 2
VDAILLSHADLEHMGGLVYAVKHLLHSAGSTAPSLTHPPPIYATLPISNLGRLTAMDHLASIRLHQDCPLYQPEEIDSIFESIKTVKYSESISLAGRAQGITLIPVAAGHTVGGTVWRLKKDTDELVYAVGYNHKKERHLDGTALDGIYRPSLLITDSFNSLITQPTRKQRDADLIETIIKTLQRDGDVLMPVDSSTRLLELVYLLDQLWAYRQLNLPLILLAPFGKRVIDYAKSMLEWMGEGVTKVFATSRETPFDFKYVIFFKKNFH